jgi:inorganic pyrophosphatase
VNKSLLDQIDEFFASYNKMRGKTFKIKKRAGPKQALAILKDGIKAYKKSKKRSNV